MSERLLLCIVLFGLTPYSIQASTLMTYRQCQQIAQSVIDELAGQMIDDVTKVSAASCSSDVTFTYEYEITDTSISKEDFVDGTAQLRTSIMTPWCSEDVDDDMAYFFSKVRALRYRYVRSDGVYLGAILFSSKDCMAF